MKRIPVIILAAALFAACAHKKNLKEEDAASAQTVVSTPAIGETDAPTVPGLGGESLEAAVPEPTSRGADFADEPELENVIFAFDKYFISDEAKAVIEKNSLRLKSKKTSDVLVEGHCDERGTIQYNIALGQKRAREVRDYYIRLGIPAQSVTTISYGKERPLCTDSNEACWAQNRRAQTKLRPQTSGN